MTRSAKTKHILASILAVLAIVASPLLVCACDHHPKIVEEKVELSSCHKQAHDNAGIVPVVSSAEATCDCVMQAMGSKFIVKNENTKLLKYVAAVEKTSTDRPEVSEGVSLMKAEFYPPALFAPDRYLNLSPGRAPPASLDQRK